MWRALQRAALRASEARIARAAAAKAADGIQPAAAAAAGAAACDTAAADVPPVTPVILAPADAAATLAAVDDAGDLTPERRQEIQVSGLQLPAGMQALASFPGPWQQNQLHEIQAPVATYDHHSGLDTNGCNPRGAPAACCYLCIAHE
jgi:hypothetical protein